MKQINVMGAIFERDGKVLLARRGMGRAMAGMWEFPGGKIMDGETEQECLKREIMEEMGVGIEVGPFFAESSHATGTQDIRLRCYKAKLLSDDMKLADHDLVLWAEPKDLLSYRLAPADVAIAKELIRGA